MVPAASTTNIFLKKKLKKVGIESGMIELGCRIGIIIVAIGDWMTGLVNGSHPNCTARHMFDELPKREMPWFEWEMGQLFVILLNWIDSKGFLFSESCNLIQNMRRNM
ncbi:uncharacterized protein LOC127257497 [Andrographis paniculata]|uniref:uncharacterized protein LOC127257497 n=1 Tax=Andrographis paniculata TaxID=175694 RepID=UPI0021E7FD14|nr:uncharacterized protein LOC127257497 [Andrographis paniculata]